MGIILSKSNEKNPKSMAESYFEFLKENMEINNKIVHVEADLGLSILGFNMMTIMQTFSEQWIECGIQEANAVGVAAGLSATGRIPFVHSFAPFISRRACDQVFISGGYSKSNIKLIGSDPGIMAAFNGGTHMPFEDIAIMRSIPEMTIVEPSDPVIAKELFKDVAKKDGMVYIRYARKNVAKLYEEGSTFTIGKGNVIKEGIDLTIIASGVMVEEGIKAV
ncbi:transketolase family protein, partial [Clostridium sediminicola]|uniref:transketolase family protein n=1 Tax=Clostridium sediminicola TaxID=3114879 RepID=UPI003D16A7B6